MKTKPSDRNKVLTEAQRCINLAIAVTALPLAALFRGNKSAYWISVLIVWFVVLAPFAGWVFERFAEGSQRIGTAENKGTTPAA